MLDEFREWYADTAHADLSRRKVIGITLDNVNNISRWQLEQYLEGRGFAVHDDEITSELREAVRLDLDDRAEPKKEKQDG